MAHGFARHLLWRNDLCMRFFTTFSFVSCGWFNANIKAFANANCKGIVLSSLFSILCILSILCSVARLTTTSSVCVCFAHTLSLHKIQRILMAVGGFHLRLSVARNCWWIFLRHFYRLLYVRSFHIITQSAHNSLAYKTTDYRRTIVYKNIDYRRTIVYKTLDYRRSES